MTFQSVITAIIMADYGHCKRHLTKSYSVALKCTFRIIPQLSL